MAIGISAVSSTDSQRLLVERQQEYAQTQKAQKAAETEDQVKLSAATQARQLKQQGQSVNQIAANLGVTAKVVDEYLGLTDTTQTEMIAAAAALINQ
jgi:hypothetical protein